MPDALFEAHLTVRDLEVSIAFYRDVVGLELAYVLQERPVAFFWIGGRGNAMLGLWSGSSSPNVMRLHVAFRTDLDAVLASGEVLQAAGVQPLDFHGHPTREPSVIGWMPAVSVFFHDPDGHLLEYLSMLPHVARPEVGVVPYSEWIASWT
ncbi:VOC family protein [Microvirga yunnanensis]|uniref:VOC family protein n=1 Tax=Microvirga yunnanensis TaxID=2953740 RepID=UPI0021CA2A6E|nr:VOC family protein [Microvirga sp. HBU65207]